MPGPQLSDEVELSVEGGVARIALNRPDKYNALTRRMLDSLNAAVRWAAVSRDVRSILICGNGDMFCAGDDLGGLGQVDGEGPNAETEVYDSYGPLVARLLTARKPIVAAVLGGAFVAGLDIALAADYRVASASTKLGPVSASLGVAGGTALLPMYVSVGTARRLLLRAKPIRGQEAFDLGLVDELVEESDVHDRAMALAKEFAAGPTLAYAATKSALLSGIGMNPLAVLNMELDYSMSGYHTRDYAEAIAAWEERREPNFTGAWT
jgi:2-(1,2-epoxy-1,2-dihydrophenyl)acetyl-CoA isomerase